MTLPFNLQQWIAENRHLLQPPVGNKQLFKGKDYIVMAVGGPNARTDYHVNETEELFYQLEGTITVNVQLEGKKTPLSIGPGEIFLLPAGIPHNPVRPAGSVGLVVERVRNSEQIDGLQWYCEKCNTELFSRFFPLKNIETDFLEVFREFNMSEQNRTCPSCGHVQEADTRYL